MVLSFGQRVEGSGAVSRRCQVCLSPVCPPGLCVLHSGPREAADGTGSAIQRHLVGLEAACACTPAGGRWMSATRFVRAPQTDRKLHTTRTLGFSSQRECSSGGGGAPLRVSGGRLDGTALAARYKGLAEEHRTVVSAICQALKDMPATAKQVPLLEGVLQPWTSMINKYVVGDVLKELKSDPSAAQAFFHWVQAQPGHNVTDLHAYNIMIGIHGRARDFAQVEALLEEMKSQNIQPGIVTFNQLLNAYGRAAKWAKVDGIRGRMAAEGLSMTIFTCREAIDAYRSFVATGGKPDIKLCSRLIWLYGQCGDTWKAQEVLRQMKVAGCVPNCFVHNTLLDAFGKAGKVKAALAVFEEIEA
eukprot:jgi/Mesen1/470/ME000101S10708